MNRKLIKAAWTSGNVRTIAQVLGIPQGQVEALLYKGALRSNSALRYRAVDRWFTARGEWWAYVDGEVVSDHPVHCRYRYP